ncbi:MAG: non-canonical purine NTP pyrophosphatase [Chloroflexi bacterium]|nr:non-canonical purine NTP pyrophosphatase [Chloroflexota bacterium]
MRILFATRNPSKVALFRPVFAGYGLEVVSLRDAPDLPSAEEDGHTVVENALAKARLHHGAAYSWTFGDDAALEIDALGGEPGVQARRWGGLLPAGISDEEWLDYLLRRLDGVPPERRTARWVAGWALVAPDGSAHVHQVVTPFRIGVHPVRPISPGWPMSALGVGTHSDPIARQGDVVAEFRAWGVLERLLPHVSDRPTRPTVSTEE